MPLFWPFIGVSLNAELCADKNAQSRNSPPLLNPTAMCFGISAKIFPSPPPGMPRMPIRKSSPPFGSPGTRLPAPQNAVRPGRAVWPIALCFTSKDNTPTSLAVSSPLGSSILPFLLRRIRPLLCTAHWSLASGAARGGQSLLRWLFLSRNSSDVEHLRSRRTPTSFTCNP